jgi:hypothetical protein
MSDADGAADHKKKNYRTKHSSRHGEKHSRNGRARRAEDAGISAAIEWDATKDNSGALADHVRSLLGNHDGGRVGIPGGYGGHYRGIHHSQAFDSVNAQACIDYR